MFVTTLSVIFVVVDFLTRNCDAFAAVGVR